jgi:hypothetical protein
MEKNCLKELLEDLNHQEEAMKSHF